MRAFAEAGELIAAICHWPWMPINVGGVLGKTVTSWPSLQADLREADATRIDREEVKDGKLVTARNSKDLTAFRVAIFELSGQAAQRAALAPGPHGPSPRTARDEGRRRGGSSGSRRR